MAWLSLRRLAFVAFFLRLAWVRAKLSRRRLGNETGRRGHVDDDRGGGGSDGGNVTRIGDRSRVEPVGGREESCGRRNDFLLVVQVVVGAGDGDLLFSRLKATMWDNPLRSMFVPP